MYNNENPGTQIAFGFDRETDEKSLGAFLRRMVAQEMLDELLPRLSSQEIESIVDLFSGLMKIHLDEEKYHRLFLGEE